MLLILSALIVAAAVAWSARQIAVRLSSRISEGDQITIHLLTIFGPAAAQAASDPHILIAWHPVAAAARKLFPKECAALDAATGATFPFSADHIERAHARWTADWLAWECEHDADCKLQRAVLEHELGADSGSAYGRARLDAIERAKLDRYQKRYEDYTRVAKALQSLLTRA